MLFTLPDVVQPAIIEIDVAYIQIEK